MTSASSSIAVSARPARSALVTLLAWGVILVSALLTPISLISLMMILAGSYGTQSTEPIGFLTVVVAPPATVVAGFGLLRRKRWAYFYMLALLGVVLAFNVYDFLTASPVPTTYTSPSGVPTTVLPTDRSMFVPMIAGCVVMLAIFLSRRVRREFAPSVAHEHSPSAEPASAQRPDPSQTAERTSAPSRADRDWRVGHVGRDRMYYEEWRGGVWQRLDIEGEMLTGRAHHAIYFASPERWQSYPEWARHRRDEIIARITSEFREPDYEYSLGGGGGAPSRASAPPAPTPSSQKAAQLLVVVLLLALAGGMAWLVSNGIATGETILPSRHATQRRAVSRVEEPAMFWFSIAIYSTLGVGSVGLLGWGVAVARRRR